MSSITKKYLMAASGLGWVGFVFAHMSGNLTMFISGDAYNAYGHAITSNKLLLLSAEAGLVTLLLIHIATAISLTRANRAARPDRYAMTPNRGKAATLASRTMVHTGAVLAVFIVIHLRVFKFGPHYDTTVGGVPMRDLYRLIVEEFHETGEVIWYVLAMCFVGYHLSHGISSTFQSLGWNHPRYTPLIKKAGLGLSALIAAGFIAQPIYIYFFVK